MMKKILTAFLLILVIGYGLVKFLSKKKHLEWGNHFTFKNELQINVDSLEVSVGNFKTIIRAGIDNSIIFEGNINMPKKNYPHKVTFKIYNNDKLIFLNADSFDCYNCDGSHLYKLKETGAEYNFIN